MQPIDPSKTNTDQTTINVNKTDSDLSKEINAKLSSALADKQRLAIGILLKQTLQRMSDSGLLSVDTQKAVLNAKKILPGEFTQLYIQDRVQQQKLLIDAVTNQSIKPAPLTTETAKQWIAGQLIQSIVFQATKNGLATLLVNQKGFFHNSLLLQPTQAVNQSSNTTSESGQTRQAVSHNLQNQTGSNTLFNLSLLKQSQAVTIKTDLALQAGQQLLLQVNKNDGQLSFNLKHSPQESHRVSQYINQLSQKQQAMPQLLASLKEIVNQGDRQQNSVFRPEFKAQVEKVIQQFPTLSQLNNAREVKTSMLNSGQFFEHKVVSTAGNNASISHDFKAALSQLVAMIKNNEVLTLSKSAPPEGGLLYKTITQENLNSTLARAGLFFEAPSRVIHAQVQPPILDANLFQLNNHLISQNRILDQLEGVLSRIILTQLHSREGGEQQILNFEIPFKHNDQQEILQLKIREQFKETQAQKGNKIWTVNLAFHLPSLGGIRIYITMDNTDLALQFWTEEENSQKLFQHYFYLLSERLVAAGFTISQLQAFQGIPDAAAQEHDSESQFIIDEKV